MEITFALIPRRTSVGFCQCCGTSKNLTRDHILPRSKGNTLKDNKQILCRHCNTIKADHIVTIDQLRQMVDMKKQHKTCDKTHREKREQYRNLVESFKMTPLQRVSAHISQTIGQPCEVTEVDENVLNFNVDNYNQKFRLQPELQTDDKIMDAVGEMVIRGWENIELRTA